ncbi:MAG: LuxR family transcriptional regulator [Nitriliruptor sp.]|nr:MAG: LuxR family transcriptional regulator [Nitriliruptor sp.]
MLLAALRSLPSLPEDHPVRGFGVPVGEVDERFAERVMASIASLDGPCWLVLDDVHRVRAPAALAVLADLMARRPGHLRLVMASRTDPPPLRRRAGSPPTLLELRAGDLAFTAPEIAELLSLHGLELDQQARTLLLARTEGWAAGLRLAVAEPLAVELSGRSDAGSVLEGLVRDNALVVREAGSTPRYRYHQLLRTFLEAELRRRDLRLWQHLHGVAARWYLDVGRPERALGHAVTCEDRELVESLLGRQGLAALLDGEPDRLAEVRHRLPSRWRRDALPPALRAALALEASDAPSAGLMRTQPVQAVLTPLTPAERDLLRELPSLMTVREIAGARHVTVNTVKTHLSSVYRKLDVHGRRAAVEVARAHGLL